MTSEKSAHDIAPTLKRVRRTLGMAKVRQWSRRGLAGGAIIGSGFLAAARVGYPLGVIPFALTVAVAATLAGGIVGAALAGWRWPDTFAAARAADRHFDLHDRLTSALEFRDSSEPLHRLQRLDTAERVLGLPLRESGRRRSSRRDLSLTSLAILAFVVLALVLAPATKSTALTTSQAARQRMRIAARITLPSLARQFPRGSQSNPTLQSLKIDLNRLRIQLLRAPSLPVALRTISLTQQEFQRLASRIRPASPRTVRFVSQALRAGTEPRSSPSISNLIRDLNRLNRLLDHLSAAARARFARSMLQASTIISDAQIRNILRHSASALANDNQPATRRALKQLLDVMKRTPEGNASLAQLKRATTQLDRVKNQLSGINKKLSRLNGRKGALLRNKKPGQGQERTVQRAGRSSRPGISGHHPGVGTSNTSSQPLVGGHVISPVFNGRGKSASTAGSHARAKKSGKYGSQNNLGPTGQGITIQINSRGLPDQGSLRRYHPIIVRYAHSARAAMGRVALPPDVSIYVRHYFSVISR